MKNLFLGAAALAATLFTGVLPSHAETTECTEITSLPTTITAQGIYCLKGNLVTNIATGNAITIDVNNVTIDLNGWKLGGAAGGPGTFANGISASGVKNIIVRNGTVRGFYRGVILGGSSGSSGHIIEDILADSNRLAGIQVEGNNVTIRNNKITDTGDSAADGVAFGISVLPSIGVDIVDNLISEVSETGSVSGIRVQSSAEINISNNRVFNLRTAALKYGIVASFDSNRVTFRNNVISTGSGGTVGIGETSINSDNLICVGNTVIGFTSNFSGCDFGSGNASL